MDSSTILVWLAALGGPTGVALICRQIRIGLRDRGDRNLLRHIYDQDRQSHVLDTLEKLRGAEARLTTRAPGDGGTGGNKTEPPSSCLGHQSSLTWLDA